MGRTTLSIWLCWIQQSRERAATEAVINVVLSEEIGQNLNGIVVEQELHLSNFIQLLLVYYL
jgi:hypothetical protein